MKAVTAINGHYSMSSAKVAITCTNEEWAALCALFGYSRENPPEQLDMARVVALRNELSGLRALPSIADQLHKTLAQLGHVNHTSQAVPHG